MTTSSVALLGDICFSPRPFPRLQEVLHALQEASFPVLNEWEKEQKISASLCALIQEEKLPCFALPSVVDYIAAVLKAGLLKVYTLSHFELWLNQFSGLSSEENAQVRGKIVGKQIPRAAYQRLFPIGMDKIYPGSHVVTAHGSPDLDTTVASFWGWMDAFGARLCTGRHLWNVPGEVPDQAEMELLFKRPFGERVFEILSQTQTVLELKAVDLMRQGSVTGATFPPQIAASAGVDAIRAAMESHPCLQVHFSSADPESSVCGVIEASDLQKAVLGTVTLRDFCNRDETQVPSYLEIISVIDHHKSSLGTSTASTVSIADVQSANVLCAEMAFEINDRFGSRGMTRAESQRQMEALSRDLSSTTNKRRLSHVLRRLCVMEEKSLYGIHPDRERLEYLHFLYGIFDDTDLLAKVSVRDLYCIVELVNRLKSLVVGQEEEVLNLDDLPLDALFIRKASQRILQHPDVYSLYKTVYSAKEAAVAVSIQACLQGDDRVFFSDTKEQNRCARVGQTKLFPSSERLFSQAAWGLRRQFHKRAFSYFKEHQAVDLHLQMISTVAGASEVFSGETPVYHHKDELWLWIPFTPSSVQHLKEFLRAFSSAPALSHQVFTAKCSGAEGKTFAQIIQESFTSIADVTVSEADRESLLVLQFQPGLINSRKALITPFLPKAG